MTSHWTNVGRERTRASTSSRPHNAKIIHFSNLPGENFLAWRSQFQVITNYHRWTDEEAKQLAYAYMKGTALESLMDVCLTGPETIGEILDEYQNRFLPESDSQLLRPSLPVWCNSPMSRCRSCTPA